MNHKNYEKLRAIFATSQPIFYFGDQAPSFPQPPTVIYMGASEIKLSTGHLFHHDEVTESDFAVLDRRWASRG